MAKPTKQVVLTTTIKATGAVVANRFVTYAGVQAKADEKIYGVSPVDAEAGNFMPVEIIGIALVEAGGAVAAGAQVGADAQGCAVSGAAKAAGTALTAATAAGEIIRVLLKG